MTQKNQFIEFTKWLFKWVAGAVICLILIGSLIWGGYAASNYYSNTMPKSKIVIIVSAKNAFSQMDDQTLMAFLPADQRAKIVSEHPVTPHDKKRATYQVKMPDGSIHEIEGPDDATPEDIVALTRLAELESKARGEAKQPQRQSAPQQVAPNPFDQFDSAPSKFSSMSDAELLQAWGQAQQQRQTRLPPGFVLDQPMQQQQSAAGPWDKYAKQQADLDADTLCTDKNYPVFIGIVNNSKRTVERISFGVTAKILNHSTNIASYQDYTSDLIIKPGEGAGNCWNVLLQTGYEKQNLRDLEFASEIHEVIFQD